MFNNLTVSRKDGQLANITREAISGLVRSLWATGVAIRDLCQDTDFVISVESRALGLQGVEVTCLKLIYNSIFH